MQIQQNFVQDNNYGMVLLHTNGAVETNQILDNRVGIWIADESIAQVKDNAILDNEVCGVDIQNIPECTLFGNKLENNGSQLKLDSEGKKNAQQYMDYNTVKGENNIPKTIDVSSCTIF